MVREAEMPQMCKTCRRWTAARKGEDCAECQSLLVCGPWCFCASCSEARDAAGPDPFDWNEDYDPDTIRD